MRTSQQTINRWLPFGLSLALGLGACGGGGNGEPDATVQSSPGERRHALAAAPATPAQSRWSAPLALPIVPVAVANLPNGKVLMWAANSPVTFNAGGQTYSSIFDPATGLATQRVVTETGHDMFCPGTSNLPDGRLLVAGGIDSGKTSIYDPVTDTWATAAPMNISRGYNANATLPDGSVLTLGGSWSGGVGGKHAEVWTATGGWRRLSGVSVGPMLGPDPGGEYRSDNHMWLVPAGNGRVLHAGPSPKMNWIDVRGEGRSTPAGTRGDDGHSVSGTAVMYDIGKILKVGGSPTYDNGADARNSAYVIDVNAGVSVRKLAPMQYPRVFHNSVVLPNGQVLIVGGQTRGVGFSDDNSVLVPELWDPVTESFTALPAITVPRNYHSVALLLPDARVMSAGGGLCGDGCAANHADAQILTPHYLLNDDGSAATRPVITAAPVRGGYGSTIQVTTDSDIASFALVRLSSTTHTVNNDQRRIPLAFSATDSHQFNVKVPTNPGIALPGQYMLFALNARGVPSVAKILRIDGDTAPKLVSPLDQSGAAGAAASLSLSATSPTSSAITYGAVGLPPGLAIDVASGLISGTPSSVGAYRVAVSASTSGGVVSTEFMWRITAQSASVRFVKLEALSEVNGYPWSSMAELNLLDAAGVPLPRNGWTVSADSAETMGESGVPQNAIDGSSATGWHSQWFTASPPPPHSFVVDIGTLATMGGFRYLPRQDGNPNGTIAQFRFYLSADGVNWGEPVAQGNFNDLGPWFAEKTVIFGELAHNHTPTVAAVGAVVNDAGTTVSLHIAANDIDGDPLSFTASGLPPGLSIGAASGTVSGIATTVGTYTTTVSVVDSKGAGGSVSFTWTVRPPPVVMAPVKIAPTPVGSTTTFTVSSNTANATYAWDFGDGSPVTAFGASTSVTHSYASAGLYRVTVFAKSASGLVTQRSFTQAVVLPATATPPRASSGIVYETRAIGNARLWVVNPDNDSVSVFDAVTRAKLAEIAVGLDPRTVAVASSTEVWVVNRGSDTVSRINTDSLSVQTTIVLPRASQPFGIVVSPSDGSAYVTLEARGELRKFSGAGLALGALAIGRNPRHLSISGDGARVLISRFITPPLPGEGTAVVQTAVGGVNRGGEVLNVSTNPLAVSATTVLRHSDKADSTVQGRGIPNYLGAAVISPDGRSAWVPSKQDNIKRGVLRDGLQLDFQNTVRAITSRIDLATSAEDHAARIDHDNSGVTSAAAFHPSGAFLFVALETSRHVAVINPAAHTEFLRVSTGRAPQGVAVSPDGLRLYVSNFVDRSVGVYDLSPLVRYGEIRLPLLATLSAVGVDKLGAQVLLGKKLFYDARDPRLARDGYLSCAACHRDGGNDGRTWDFTGFGEGLRNTPSLRGRGGAQGALHWSANFDEVQDFEGQIRSFAQGTGLMSNAQFNAGTTRQPLGDRKTGVNANLDALAAYVQSLAGFDRSPYRAATGELTATAAAGKAVFAAQCVQCHHGASFTDSPQGILHNVGTLKSSSGKRLGGTLSGIDTPTLRDAWATAPYLHDGSAATLSAAITAHNGMTLTSTQLAQVAAYVQQIGSEEATPSTALGSVRFVKLEALSEVNGQPWSSMAELNLLDAAGTTRSRSGWTVSADSFESMDASALPQNVIDGNNATGWHTQWFTASPPPPHSFIVNLGTPTNVGGFRYLPRQDGNPNGTIAKFRFYTSADGVNWSIPTAQGDFRDMGATAAEKTVLLK